MRPRHPLFALWLLLLAGAGGGCKERQAPSLKLDLEAAREVGDFKARITTAAGDRAKIAAGTVQGGVLLWRLGSGVRRFVSSQEPDKAAPFHRGPVRGVGFSSQGVVSIGGKSAASWDATFMSRLKDIRGPQKLKAMAMAQDGQAVFFATDHGHVLRWDLQRSTATPVKSFDCGAAAVTPVRLQLPPEKRCPYGSHVLLDDDQSVCFYPVTVMLNHGGYLFRACRSGTLGKLHLKTRKVGWASAGHLRTLTPVGPEHVLLGRQDGRLDLYDPNAGTVIRKLLDKGPRPRAAATSDSLIAVAYKTKVLFWPANGNKPMASLRPPGPVAWIMLHRDPLEVRLLLKSGKLIAYRLKLTKSSSKGS